MLSCMLNGNRICIYDYDKDELKKWANKKILVCPVCGKPYEVCWGKIRIPYFRHADKSECEGAYSEAETQEHLKGKMLLYEWIKKQDGVTDCILEGWIPETKQRPDIMFKFNNVQCVIEYQCSPISSEYFERHDLYKAAGIKDIWICGTLNYFQFYNKGAGNKKFNIVESNALLYLDVKTEQIFKYADVKLKDYNCFLSRQSSEYAKKKYKNNPKYLMQNIFDYKIGKENYCDIKSLSLNHSFRCIDFDYPKASQFPSPINELIFTKFITRFRCYKLKNLKLKEICN